MFPNDGGSRRRGIGQMMKSEKVVFNFWTEPQYSIADEGAGWAKWQIFVGLHSQFN